MKNLTTKNEADEAINKNGDKHAKSIKTFFLRERERTKGNRKERKLENLLNQLITSSFFSTTEKTLKSFHFWSGFLVGCIFEDYSSLLTFKTQKAERERRKALFAYEVEDDVCGYKAKGKEHITGD